MVVRGAPNPQALAQPRLPLVALLETLPRPTKTPSRFLQTTETNYIEVNLLN